MFKILGVVSCYYPDIDEFEQNIKSYISKLDLLIIWENTPLKDSKIEAFVKRLNEPNVEYRSTGKNEFLAYPFNEIVKYAQNNGFTHLLTMDQDSIFMEGHFASFINIITNSNDNKIGIHTPAINTNDNLNEKVLNLRFAPSSGSIYPIEIFEKVGVFREDFLIYPIDVEFCYRVRKKGYLINCYSDIILNHKMGYSAKGKYGLILNNYSAQSTYYMIRNNIILWKEYPEEITFNQKLIFIRYKIIYRILKIVFEKNSFLKSKALIMGVYHALIEKTGPYKL
jgi:rhamnosyltransferase